MVEPVLQFYRFIKDEPRAAEIAGAVLELDPQNSLALNTRYESRAKAKKYKEAALDLIVLRQLDSTDALVGKQTQWLTDMLRYEGDQLRKGNQADEAAAYFQLGLELSPHDHDLRNRMAHADQGQIAQLLEIVSKNPSDYPMHIRLDGALAVQRRFPEIIEMWDRYIESNPQDARAYYERGGAKKYARRTDAAMDIKRACDMGMAAACDVVARFGLKKTQN